MNDTRSQEPSEEDWIAFKAVCQAASAGETTKIREFLIGRGNPNYGAEGGLTLLHFASQACRLDLVELLLKHGADPNLVDFDGMGPLYEPMLSARKSSKFVAIVKALCVAGADPDHPNRWGGSPRGWAKTPELQAVLAATNNITTRTPSRRPVPFPRKVPKEDWWKVEHQRLWDELVPASGQASTVQGEVIRIVGKLIREAYDNGNGNWDKDCVHLWSFVANTLDDPATFSIDERAQINRWVRTIIRDQRRPDLSGNGSPYYLVNEKVVAWVLAHPEPIAHTADPNIKR